MITALIPAIGGLNETENCQSLAQLVIDDEIVAIVKRIMRGIKIDHEHLATDLIISKGPGGSFLETEHTLNYFREHFDPKISNRKTYEKWVNDGSKTTKERAAEKAREILKKKPEYTLDSKIVNEIYNVVKEVEGNG